jgi:uncharacterized protein YjiS (DUF1127 family)
MATFTSIATNHPQRPVLDLFRHIGQSFTNWRAEQRRRARIARELATYTDRELFDLRISRADIPAIVNGTYSRY